MVRSVAKDGSEVPRRATVSQRAELSDIMPGHRKGKDGHEASVTFLRDARVGGPGAPDSGGLLSYFPFTAPSAFFRAASNSSPGFQAGSCGVSAMDSPA